MATRARRGRTTGKRSAEGRSRWALATAAVAALLLPWVALGIVLGAPAAAPGPAVEPEGEAEHDCGDFGDVAVLLSGGLEGSAAEPIRRSEAENVPPDPERAPEPPPREVIFVIDTSGSMHGASIEQAKAALVAALRRLRPVDTFNVIAFASAPRALFPGSWPALPESLAKAERWIGGLVADGGTEMLPALAAALGPPAEGYGAPGRAAVRQVVILTNGAVADEDELFAYLEGHAGSARLFAVGIGPAPNGRLLGRAAEIGRGTYVPIGGLDQVAERIEALTGELERPLLAAGEAAGRRAAPVAMPDGWTPAGALPVDGTPAALPRVLGIGLLLFAAALALALRRGLRAPQAAR